MSRKQSESIRRTVSEGLKKDDFIAIGGKSFYAMTWEARDAAMAKDPALAARYAEVKARKTAGTATPEAPRKSAGRRPLRRQGAKAPKKSRKRSK
jgi:hypothetical protein